MCDQLYAGTHEGRQSKSDDCFSGLFVGHLCNQCIENVYINSCFVKPLGIRAVLLEESETMSHAVTTESSTWPLGVPKVFACSIV